MRRPPARGRCGVRPRPGDDVRPHPGDEVRQQQRRGAAQIGDQRAVRRGQDHGAHRLRRGDRGRGARRRQHRRGPGDKVPASHGRSLPRPRRGAGVTRGGAVARPQLCAPVHRRQLPRPPRRSASRRRCARGGRWSSPSGCARPAARGPAGRRATGAGRGWSASSPAAGRRRLPTGCRAQVWDKAASSPPRAERAAIMPSVDWSAGAPAARAFGPGQRARTLAGPGALGGDGRAAVDRGRDPRRPVTVAELDRDPGAAGRIVRSDHVHAAEVRPDDRRDDDGSRAIKIEMRQRAFGPDAEPRRAERGAKPVVLRPAEVRPVIAARAARALRGVGHAPAVQLARPPPARHRAGAGLRQLRRAGAGNLDPALEMLARLQVLGGVGVPREARRRAVADDLADPVRVVGLVLLRGGAGAGDEGDAGVRQGRGLSSGTPVRSARSRPSCRCRIPPLRVGSAAGLRNA